MGQLKLKRGLFITLEGPEGIGKTTMKEMLYDYLSERYMHVIATREPGGTELGQKLRELILHSETPISKQALLLLFHADRADHVDALIRPALEEGQIVICDRYVDTTLAYQGWGAGHSTEVLAELHKIATGDLMPDITFVLYGEPHRERGDDRYERLDDEFHQRVRDCYGYLRNNAQRGIGRYKPIYANRPVIAVLDDMVKHLRMYLATRT